MHLTLRRRTADGNGIIDLFLAFPEHPHPHLTVPLDGVYVLKLLLHIFILFHLLIEPGVAASKRYCEVWVR